jgi:hypothetical protein
MIPPEFNPCPPAQPIVLRMEQHAYGWTVFKGSHPIGLFGSYAEAMTAYGEWIKEVIVA